MNLFLDRTVVYASECIPHQEYNLIYEYVLPFPHIKIMINNWTDAPLNF